MFRQCLTIFCALLFLLACSACGKKEAAPPAHSILRISSENDLQTLDPRRARDLSTATAIHMLYEGLMRSQAKGLPALALAESVAISPDQKTYAFTLRRSAWSNGEPVTAYDFEQTWKSVLDPEFPSPNAYQLYAIRGAQAAKEGRAPTEHIGVRAQDNRTLIVELEQPTPYFLDLAATHFYYPVHASLYTQKADEKAAQEVVTNGPYRLDHWNRHDEWAAIPNPHYWDASSVRLNQIVVAVLDNSTALQLFQRGELDWAGSPLSTLPPDALAFLKNQGKLEAMPAAGVYLFRVHTERPPFTNAKMRQAFALALNRRDLVEHVLQGGQTPALGIVPPSFIHGEPLFKDHDVQHARQLLQEALKEQNLTVQDLPPISIDYASGERAHKIAQVAQQQWKEVLGIHAELHGMEGKVYYDRLKNHDYQLGIGSWFADFRDPISFLEVFKLKNNGTNNTQWENPRYVALLNQSTQAIQPSEREALLREAEKTLIEDMPVIPLFYNSYNYLRKPAVQGVYFSELGYLDFKNAYIQEP